MKKHILALVLTMVCISLYAVNPIKEGNMISGHVIVKGTEENIPYATILGTVVKFRHYESIGRLSR